MYIFTFAINRDVLNLTCKKNSYNDIESIFDNNSCAYI